MSRTYVTQEWHTGSDHWNDFSSITRYTDWKVPYLHWTCARTYHGEPRTGKGLRKTVYVTPSRTCSHAYEPTRRITGRICHKCKSFKCGCCTVADFTCAIICHGEPRKRTNVWGQQYHAVYSSRSRTHADKRTRRTPFVDVTKGTSLAWDSCCCTWNPAAARGETRNEIIWPQLLRRLKSSPRAPYMFQNLPWGPTYGYRGLKSTVLRCSLFSHTHAHSPSHTQKHRSCCTCEPCRLPLACPPPPRSYWDGESVLRGPAREKDRRKSVRGSTLSVCSARFRTTWADFMFSTRHGTTTSTLYRTCLACGMARPTCLGRIVGWWRLSSKNDGTKSYVFVVGTNQNCLGTCLLMFDTSPMWCSAIRWCACTASLLMISETRCHKGVAQKWNKIKLLLAEIDLRWKKKKKHLWKSSSGFRVCMSLVGSSWSESDPVVTCQSSRLWTPKVCATELAGT